MRLFDHSEYVFRMDSLGCVFSLFELVDILFPYGPGTYVEYVFASGE